MRSYRYVLGLFAAAVLMLVSPRAQAGTWVEQGDAPSQIGTAQVTHGGGALTEIRGAFSATTDVDLYEIRISDPVDFSATTVGLTHDTLHGSGPLDTVLFLFDATGHAVYANDDAAAGVIESTLPAGLAVGPQTAGIYYLAIAGGGSMALNSTWAALFVETQPTDVMGPASGATLGHWGAGGDNEGTYAIDLTGAQFAAGNPEPVSATLAAMGLAALALRRYRRATA